MELKGKNIVVTGGAGFVGSHLVDRLIDEQPAKITVLSNFSLGRFRNLARAINVFRNLEIKTVDISDVGWIGKTFPINTDVVFNLAAVPLPRTFSEPEFTLKQNINMTLNLCELQRKGWFETLMQFSSSEVYGTKRTKGPMSEQHPTFPTTPYAASKLAADHIVLTYIKTFGIDASIIRPFNIYGPRQNMKEYAGVIPLTIRRILKGECINVDGDGKQTRDYVFVSDVADATVDIYKNINTRGKVLNVASGRSIEIGYLIEKIANIMKYDKPIVHGKRRVADVDEHEADISLAKALINYAPKVVFEDGIKTTVEWYREEYNV